jgi:hypothetical protein
MREYDKDKEAKLQLPNSKWNRTSLLPRVTFLSAAIPGWVSTVASAGTADLVDGRDDDSSRAVSQADASCICKLLMLRWCR